MLAVNVPAFDSSILASGLSKRDIEEGMTSILQSVSHSLVLSVGE